jgi:hypothetical protein
MQEAADPAAAPIHQMMDRQVDHLVRLVDDLLEVSRISRGTFELRRERVELATVVRNAVDTSNPLIHAAGHQLTVSMPREPLWLDGDPVRLAQILAILLNNAATYTEHGGRISVRAWRDDGHALIAVRDNGSGNRGRRAAAHVPDVPPRQRPRAGATRVAWDRALARPGARRMHGGTITVKSEGPGRGSEFTVRLPLAASQPAPAAERSADDALPPRRILVVDDNRDAADSLGLLLKVLGAEVRVARDGAEALEATAATTPRWCCSTSACRNGRLRGGAPHPRAKPRGPARPSSRSPDGARRTTAARRARPDSITTWSSRRKSARSRSCSGRFRPKSFRY